MKGGSSPYSPRIRAGSIVGAGLFSVMLLAGCGEKSDGGGGGGAAGTAGAGVTGGVAGSAGTAGAATGGVSATGGGGTPAAGAGGDGAGLGGLAGATGGGAGGAAGMAGSAGMAGDPNLPPYNLSETGLFTARGAAPGELVLGPGVREFEPRYWLWSDGSDKNRYVYLPPGTQIDTTDPDHWVFPLGTKLWKSFIRDGQLVETRLLERFGAGVNEFRYATYLWETATAPDAIRMGYRNERIDAAGTPHDIPNGQACERCHNALKDHALGFSALQLNHNLPGVTLQTLLDEGLLTTPISTSIGMPGPDQATRDAVGYLHANCGNCHNDSPGQTETTIPPPQILLRVLVADTTLEQTGVFRTAVNQRTTASADLAIEYRIRGGSSVERESAVWYRMNLRMIEDQMPPIASELQDPTGLTTISSWIQSLPPPP
jgi:hypothetical protein